MTFEDPLGTGTGNLPPGWQPGSNPAEQGQGITPQHIPVPSNFVTDELTTQDQATGFGRESGNSPGDRFHFMAGTPQLPPPAVNTENDTPPPTTTANRESSVLGDLGGQITEGVGVTPEQVDATLTEIVDGLPENVRAYYAELAAMDPSELTEDQASFMGFLTAMAEFITTCRQVINHIEQHEAENFDELQSRHYQALDDFNTQLDQVREAIEKAREMAKIMDIVAPVLMAVMAIIAIAATILTAGAAGPAMIVAMVAVTVVMTSLMIADQQTGGVVTGAFAKEMAKATAALGDALGSDLAASIIMAIVAIIIMVVVIAGTKGAGGAAATSMFTAVLRAVLVNVITTAATITITSSGAISRAIEEIALACGADEDEAALWGMILEALIMIMFAICSGVAASNMNTNISSTAEQTAKAAIQSAGKIAAASGAAAAIIQASTQIAVNVRQAELALERGDAEAAMEEMKEVLLKILGINKDQLMDAMDALFAQAQQLSQDNMALWDTASKMVSQATSSLQG